MRKPEPADQITRRVRLHRKRQREALKHESAFLFGLQNHLRDYDLDDRTWVSALDVYMTTEVLNVFLSFDRYALAIVGSKKVPGIKNIETTNVWIQGSLVLMIRPAHIPQPRRRS